MFINQPCKQFLTYGEDSKIECKKFDFALAIHLLRKKRMRKLAKENVQRFNSGIVQVVLCLPLFMSIRGLAERKVCMQGPLQLPQKPGIMDNGL